MKEEDLTLEGGEEEEVVDSHLRKARFLVYWMTTTRWSPISRIIFSYSGNITASGHTCFSYFDAVPFAYSYSHTFLSFLDPRHHLNFAYLHINHHRSQQSQYLHIIVFSSILSIFPSPVSRRRWPTRPLWLWLLSRAHQAASPSASVELWRK